jgi:elongation factor 1 alpha-like protein
LLKFVKIRLFQKFQGIGDRLLEKSAIKVQPTTPTITVTPTAKKANNVTRGFEINSPRIQSPITSGRNTPERTEEQFLLATKSKEAAARNAREMYEKERSGNKQNLHMVVIGHVDAGKSTLMGHLLYDLGNIPQRGEFPFSVLFFKVLKLFV